MRFSSLAVEPNQAHNFFQHGVASFDPTPDAVLLWTRITPPEGTVPMYVPLEWQISTQDFSDKNDDIRGGHFVTGPERDYTVTIDATGLLPHTRYYYRFICNGQISATGRTKTLASGQLEEAMFAVVSCANWGFGKFNVYDLCTKIDNLDFVLHLGDYIYEYEKYSYPDKPFLNRHGLRPKKRCETLADFRARYSCYRKDPALQELHRVLPMIATWDDHEISDDCYTAGAEDIKGSKEAYQALKYQAIHAFSEWVPVRGMGPDCINPCGVHRVFHIGDLMSIILVENRISNKTKPLDMEETKFFKQVAEKRRKEWDQEQILQGKEELLEAFKDPERHMIGERQLTNVAEAVKESVEGHAPWQFYASQVILGQLKAPKLVETLPLLSAPLRWICKAALKIATSEKISGEEASHMAKMYLGMGQAGVMMNNSAWDGYAVEREQVLNALNIPGSNPIVLCGDSHNAWSQELMDMNGVRKGVEFNGPAVTSIGAFEDIYSRFKAKLGKLTSITPLFYYTPWIRDALRVANPDTLKYSNLQDRGLIVLHVTRRRVHAEYHYVSQVKSRHYRNFCEQAFYVEVGEKKLVETPRYLTVQGGVPHRHQRKRVKLLAASQHVKP